MAVTRGGNTARVLSSLRPDASVLAVTEQEDVARRLSLYRACIRSSPLSALTWTRRDRRVAEALLARGLVAPGDTVVVVSISQDLDHQSANYLKLERLGTR